MNNKVKDLELITFLSEGDDNKKQSIIFEVLRSPVDPFKGPSEQDEVLAKSLQQLTEKLEQLGLKTNSRLNKLGWFYVLEVTPSQLQQLVDLPFIQAIRLNRFRRRK